MKKKVAIGFCVLLTFSVSLGMEKIEDEQKEAQEKAIEANDTIGSRYKVSEETLRKYDDPSTYVGMMFRLEIAELLPNTQYDCVHK